MRIRSLPLCFFVFVIIGIQSSVGFSSVVKEELKGLACVRLHVFIAGENSSNRKLLSGIRERIIAFVTEELRADGLLVWEPECDALFYLKIRLPGPLLAGRGDPVQSGAALVTAELREPARISRLGQGKEIIVSTWQYTTIIDISTPSKLEEDLMKAVWPLIFCFRGDWQGANQQ